MPDGRSRSAAASVGAVYSNRSTARSSQNYCRAATGERVAEHCPLKIFRGLVDVLELTGNSFRFILQVVAFSPISRSAYNKALRLTLKAPGQKAGFRWRTGDGERMEMHFWLRAARNTGLLPPDDCHDDEVPAQLKDSESGPSIPPAHIQTTMAEAAYALPDSHFDAERQRRSGPPPPPPPLRDTMDASRLDTAVRESVAEEEASFVKSREKKEASSLPSEAKKLQWLQPYIKGVRMATT